MDYCMEHPEELTKVAAVQKKVHDGKPGSVITFATMMHMNLLLVELVFNVAEDG